MEKGTRSERMKKKARVDVSIPLVHLSLRARVNRSSRRGGFRLAKMPRRELHPGRVLVTRRSQLGRDHVPGHFGHQRSTLAGTKTNADALVHVDGEVRV